MKHTPAPWKVHKTLIGSLCIGNAERKVQIANISQLQPKSIAEYDELEANARLIACAPELLSSLKDLIAIFDSGKEPFKYLTRIQSQSVHIARLMIENAEGK